MEVQFTPELEAKLVGQAVRQGRQPGDLVQDAVSRYIEEEERFIAAVTRGEAALAAGDYLTHEQVAQRLARFLQA